MRTETGGALVLLGATLAALAWANSPWWHTYDTVWRTPLSIRVGRLVISQDLRHRLNNGLMTFFLVVGLEAKRELDIGELQERRRRAVSMVAALGGTVVPVAIYLAVNAGGQGGHGWGAAMSTDIAFALGVLALVAPASTRLCVRLLTLTLSDDLVALLVIIVAYTGGDGMLEGALRELVIQALAACPGVVALGPCGLSLPVDAAVAQQLLGDAVARSGASATQIVAAAHEVTQSFLLGGWGRNKRSARRRGRAARASSRPADRS
jgi:Na+/H+ antiporter NhaA